MREITAEEVPKLRMCIEALKHCPPITTALPQILKASTPYGRTIKHWQILLTH